MAKIQKNVREEVIDFAKNYKALAQSYMGLTIFEKEAVERQDVYQNKQKERVECTSEANSRGNAARPLELHNDTSDHPHWSHRLSLPT